MTAKPYEAFFEDVIRRVTGDEVVHVDDGSSARMVDAHIRSADGSVAALEITTVTENRAMQMESLPTDLVLPETPHWWDLRYPGVSLNWKEAELHVPALIRWLDQFKLNDAEKLGDWISPTPEWQWYRRTGIRLRHYAGASHGGRVDILPNGKGAIVDSRLEGLAAWVEGLQQQPIWVENVIKLASSGYDDLHLAIRVHESGMPASLWMGMWDPVDIAASDPNAMEPLTNLWLLSAYGRTVVHWAKDVGWRAREYEVAPNPNAYEELFEGELHDEESA